LKGICASGWTIAKNHCMMHGQQNVKNMCPSSAETTVFMRHLVLVILYV